jgi:homocysteine S-methyltransferase
MSFSETVIREPFILAEGAVIERLRREPSVSMDAHVLHAGFVYDARARTALGDVYRQYLDIGRRHALPMIVLTPTWRANPERLSCAGLAHLDVNGDDVRFMAGLVAQYGDYARQVFLGGLMGCAGDAYRPQGALAAREAESFHAPQAQALAHAGVDFLMAATLPAYSEALGLARGMARCGKPYVLSFVLRPGGTLLDGTPLHKAVRRIDASVSPAPTFYLVNCVHPTVFEQACECELARSPAPGDPAALGKPAAWAGRVLGLQGNTSSRSPEQLDGLAQLETEEPSTFAAAMLRLHERFGTRVLGGCCGTDDRHIARIAEHMSALLARWRRKSEHTRDDDARAHDAYL